jgi:hypothetical protein
VINQMASQVAVAYYNNVVLHFAGEHAASFLRIVPLQGLKNENGDDDSKQDALAPESIENPERSGLDPEIDRIQESFGEREMFDAVEDNSSQSEPQRQQHEAPAALAEKESDSNPEEAAHVHPAGEMLGGAAKQVNAKKQG